MNKIITVLRSINRYDKMTIPYSVAVALLDVAVPFAGIFLPKLILELLLIQAPPSQIITKAGAYALLLAALGFLSDFSIRNRAWCNEYIKGGGSADLFLENLDCEYSYLEAPDKQALFARLLQDTRGNTEFCYNKLLIALAGIMTGTIGFILYSFVLSGLNLWVVMMLTTTATVNYFAVRWANRYEHKNKGNWTPLERKIAYLLRMSGDASYGKDIRMYNMKPWIVELACNLFSERMKWDNSVQNHHFLAKLVNAATVLIRDGVAYAMLIYMVTRGKIGVSDFILFFGAIAGFSTFVTKIIESMGKLGSALPYVGDMLEYLGGGNCVDPDNPAVIPESAGALAIDFKDVCFSYSPECKVLDKLTFSIKAGEKIAIVGLNGAGKTTIVKLLCGFYTPDEGEICINGVNIQHFRKQYLYNLFSVVFQDEFIQPVTMAANITPNTADSNGIKHSLQRAGLWDYVSTLPKGLQSLMTKTVREDGVILSGGQMQKLYLTRALYKDAPIFILDEPTAALDPIAESGIYEKYHELSAGKTSIFISHRLASTRFCDKIILIANGAVQESGAHQALLAQGGEYARLFEMQKQYYDNECETPNRAGVVR